MRLRALAFAFFAVISLPAMARTWTGAVSSSWSDPGNWSPAGVPTATESLFFPKNAVTKSVTFDAPAGTAVGTLNFSASYTISGNALTLVHGLYMSGGYPYTDTVTFETPITLGESIEMYLQVRFDGAFDVNGKTLTLRSGGHTFAGAVNGSGVIDARQLPVAFLGGGTFSGTVRDGHIEVDGDLSDATMQGALIGNGSVGDLTVTIPNGATLAPGARTCCPYAPSIGTLHTRSLKMAPGSGGPSYFDVDLGAGASDVVQVTGTVTLAGILQTSMADAHVPSIGETFVIIDNDGTDPVSGTFNDFPEDAQVMAGRFAFRISYRGGDGNDVVLTASEPVPAIKTWTGAHGFEWSDKGNWTPAAVPYDGEPLNFPDSVSNQFVDYVPNASTPTTVGALTFGGTYLFLDGYAYDPVGLTLNGNVAVAPGEIWSSGVRLKLGAAINFRGEMSLGAVDMNGKTLTLDPSSNISMEVLDGSGSIAANGASMTLRSGAFNGTISGGDVTLGGNLPGANVTGALRGHGTIGEVHIVSSPGVAATIAPDGPFEATLSTRSLWAEDVSLDLDGYPAYADRIEVTGSVTISGPLHLRSKYSAPVDGTVFTLIANDGTDPVSGTFDGLPEGAEIMLGGKTTYLSYRGGDGNDIVLFVPPYPGKKAWTGAANGLWSETRNWLPPIAPVAGDALVFPAGAAHTSMTNDLAAGTRIASMELLGDYTLQGNAISLSGDVTFAAGVSTFTCNADITLAAPLRLGAASTQTTWGGAIDGGAYTFTIMPRATLAGPLRGSGNLLLDEIGRPLAIAADGSFSGTIGGRVELTGSLPDARIRGSLSGSGTAGSVSIEGGTAAAPATLAPGVASACCGDAKMIGTLHTGSLATGTTTAIDLRSGAADRVEVTGSVTLAGALALQLAGTAPLPGEQFTIVDNDGNDAVQGTFTGAPEGAFVSAGSGYLRITYRGGDGNDVVLLVIDPTTTQLTQSAASTRAGETVTFTATVTGQATVPSGSVTFSDNGSVLQSVPLVNGSASLTWAGSAPGTHNIAVSYEGAELLAPSSAALSHTIARGETASSLTLGDAALVYGNTTVLTASVQAVAPAAGTPRGKVTVLDNGTAVATVALSNGAASLPALALGAGTHAVAVSYGGDVSFEPSTSNAASLTITKAATVIAAAPAEGGVRVNVVADRQPSVTVTGIVVLRERDVVVGQAEIAGYGLVPLVPLAAGVHVLDATYLGNENLEPSSSSVSIEIAQPAISVRDLVVSEGNSGTTTAKVRVELSSISADSVSVGYTTRDGGARDGSDYDAASGTLTFAPGQTSAEIALTIHGDAALEEDETFALELSAPVNATLRRAAGTVTILNDDLSYRAILDVPYSQAPPLTLDVYVPSGGKGPFPLIVWIPGTVGYDALGRTTPALRETSRGYAVAIARYRPATTAHFPAQLDDLRNAIRFLRANGAQWQLDTRRIAAWGSSAGGHLAALLGTTNDAAKAAGTATADVQAVIAFGAATDLMTLQQDAFENHCPGSYEDDSSMQAQLIGCLIFACGDRAQQASPLHFVTRDDAPFLLIHGGADCLIPPGQSRRLYDALRSAGVSATLRTLTAGAPGTWNEAATAALVDPFLDAQLTSGSKRRSVRQ